MTLSNQEQEPPTDAWSCTEGCGATLTSQVEYLAHVLLHVQSERDSLVSALEEARRRDSVALDDCIHSQQLQERAARIAYLEEQVTELQMRGVDLERELREARERNTELMEKGTELHSWLCDVARAVSGTALRPLDDLALDVEALNKDHLRLVDKEACLEEELQNERQQFDSLNATAVRYREALERIAQPSIAPTFDKDPAVQSRRDIARRALQTKEGE